MDGKDYEEMRKMEIDVQLVQQFQRIPSSEGNCLLSKMGRIQVNVSLTIWSAPVLLIGE